MRRFCVRLLTAVLAVAIVSPVMAQPGPRGGGGMGAMFLLTNKGVVEELKLSEEQQDKLKKATSDLQAKHKDDLDAARKDMDREKSAKIRKEMNTAYGKTVEEVLKPAQVKRLHQIEVQIAGPQAFAMERVQKELKLDDKQKEAIKEQEKSLADARTELFKDVGMDREKRQEAQKKLTEKRKEAMEKIASSLNEDQKKAWKEMTGAAFEFKFERPRRPQ